MKKRTTWLSIGGGIGGVIILAVVAVTLIVARPASPTSVTLERTRAPEGIPAMSFSPHTVNDTAKAQKLYDAVRALQPLQTNAMWSCPLGFGTRYQLTFRSTSGVQLTARLDGDGCRFLVIAGGQGYYTDAAFWQILANTFGVSEEQLLPAPPR